MAGIQAEQGVATYSYVAHMGQPGRAQEPGHGHVVVGAWGGASVHAPLWVMVEHGGVSTAYRGATSIVWAAPTER